MARKRTHRPTKYQRVRRLALELDAVDATGSGVTREFEEVYGCLSGE
jgi:hypothetical protein